MIGTESGSIFQSFDERYSLGNDSAVVRPNYIAGMVQAERLWKWITLHDYFAGNFMWTGIDYLGESTWPFKGFASGAMDITGQPKDAYYLYQSLWTDRPVLHLFPHWNWAGRVGQVIRVVAYTTCNSVELFLNGRSLGEKRIEFPAQGTSGGWNSYAQPVVRATTNDLHVSWDVPYEPGVLKAVGKDRAGKVMCNAEVRTAGAPAAILLRFAVTGGSIVALDNGNQLDLDPYRSDHRHAFNGRGLAILRATPSAVIRLTVTGDGLRDATVTIRVRAASTTPALPAVR